MNSTAEQQQYEEGAKQLRLRAAASDRITGGTWGTLYEVSCRPDAASAFRAATQWHTAHES